MSLGDKRGRASQMSQNPMFSLCAQDQLARTVLCHLPSSSSQSNPAFSPGSQVPPQAHTNGSFQEWEEAHSNSFSGQVLSGQPELRAGWRRVTEHPQWTQELGKLMCGGPRAISVSFRNPSGTVHLPKQGHIHKSSNAPVWAGRLSA